MLAGTSNGCSDFAGHDSDGPAADDRVRDALKRILNIYFQQDGTIGDRLVSGSSNSTAWYRFLCVCVCSDDKRICLLFRFIIQKKNPGRGEAPKHMQM